MTDRTTSNWLVFRKLCRVLSGQEDLTAASIGIDGELDRLSAMASELELLPALALRYEERPNPSQVLDRSAGEKLARALRANTLRNLEISAQAIKLARQLNQADIIPLFLKGTALLLTGANRHIGFRMQVDIDVLVKPSQLGAAAQSMLANGYDFYDLPANDSASESIADRATSAINRTAAHHHLPPMAKQEFAATVELHRHYLPKRFQQRCQLQAIFESAVEHENHGATFAIPSCNDQLVHLILGNVIHDGYLARRQFPLREAMDYIGLLERSKGGFNEGLVEHYCGASFTRFHHQVTAMTSYSTAAPLASTYDISRDMALMKMRCNSRLMNGVLDAYARANHLGITLLSNPALLPRYLHNLGKA